MLKKTFPIMLMAILLGSCDAGPKEGADGYRFGQKQYVKTTVQVNVVEYESWESFNKELTRRGLAKDTIAFTTLRPPFDTCTIHMINPNVQYEPEFIGHEFAHCLYGQWHTDNKSKS